ncbi:MAG: peptidoglycan DD-metalloendopeptidase family protein [Burkholderiaceae bacterium]
MIQARSFWFAAMVVGLAGCASKPLAPAPIVERSATPAARPAAPAPLVRDNGRDSYTVQRGDTLYSIALAKGIDPRELARWNEISNPSLIQVGQVLRLKPATAAPVAETGAVASTAPVSSSHQVETRPLSGVPAVAAIKPEVIQPEPNKPEAPKADAASSPIDFRWPAKGAVIGTFEEPRNKGIDIAGTEGEPVLAAADGEVAYIGSALRGYGNLVIIKHSDDFVSAYAHNKQVVVKQGQAVKKGQRIADLGKSDADRPKLHFEIRRQGKPVDPIRYLPAR